MQLSEPAVCVQGLRLSWVSEAFSLLDPAGHGAVAAATIIDTYDPAAHPDVLLGLRHSDEVHAEFLQSFDGGADADHDGFITAKEFAEYYATLSHYVESDDYFRILAATWRPAAAGRPSPPPPPPPPPPPLSSAPFASGNRWAAPAPPPAPENDPVQAGALSQSMRNWREGHAQVRPLPFPSPSPFSHLHAHALPRASLSPSHARSTMADTRRCATCPPPPLSPRWHVFHPYFVYSHRSGGVRPFTHIKHTLLTHIIHPPPPGGVRPH